VVVGWSAGGYGRERTVCSLGTTTVTAASVAFLPREIPHTLRITSPSEVLLVCTPAGLERYFDAIGWDPSQPKPQGRAPASPQTMAPAAAESGQQILGPPLGDIDAMPAEYLKLGRHIANRGYRRPKRSCG
jgi:hypothetical protein